MTSYDNGVLRHSDTLAPMAKIVITRQRWEQLAEDAHFDAKELARLCNLSSRQLLREFRRCLGRTPQEWLNERRIVAAQQLLLSGRQIKAVAFELGFKQVSHFCRQFKSTHRMTPSEFALTRTRVEEKCRSGITNVAHG
jgi:AraC-like DNA-binding protein